jgi:hypothetical protein
MFECVDRRSSEISADQSQTHDTMQTKMEVFNKLTEREKEEGWELLFDGISLTGWRGYNNDGSEAYWNVENGTLVAPGRGGDIGGDIITVEQYENFELALEWKISPGGNSGILFHIQEGNYNAIYETGPEYQIIDDLGYPEPLADWQRTGANYGMHPPGDSKIKPAGEWNSSRIVVEGNHVEHWLNGLKVVEYVRWDESWYKSVEEGKWKDYPDYARSARGHIGLQDHGNKTWFRNIRIRIL